MLFYASDEEFVVLSKVELRPVIVVCYSLTSVTFTVDVLGSDVTVVIFCVWFSKQGTIPELQADEGSSPGLGSQDES